MSYNVAVLGATGAVGHEMLSILAERNFPIQNIYALASKNSTGKEVSYGDEVLKYKTLKILISKMLILRFFRLDQKYQKVGTYSWEQGMYCNR